MRLNEYPKEELKVLYRCVLQKMESIHLDAPGRIEFMICNEWIDHIKEAIRDAEFQEQELPFPNKPKP